MVRRLGHGSFIDVDLGLIFGQGRNQDHASCEAQSAKQKKKKKKIWHMHTMECYSAKRKKETLPFATTVMDPEDIMLSEGSQIKINTAFYGITCVCNP